MKGFEWFGFFVCSHKLGGLVEINGGGGLAFEIEVVLF